MEVGDMNRTLFYALLTIAASALFQPFRAAASSPEESAPAFTELTDAEETAPDSGSSLTSAIVPEEPPTILLVAIGLVLTGVGRKLKKGQEYPKRQ
jgi:hypothetical protein